MTTIPLNVSRCGFNSEYQSHLRHNERPCILCRLAHNAYMRERRTLKGDLVRATERLRYATHIGAMQVKGARSTELRRARKSDNGRSDYTVEDVILTYGSDCYLCGEAINMSVSGKAGRPGWRTGLHIDHAIPVNRGGPDSLDNVRPSHGLCNLRRKH